MLFFRDLKYLNYLLIAMFLVLSGFSIFFNLLTHAKYANLMEDRHSPVYREYYDKISIESLAFYAKIDNPISEYHSYSYMVLMFYACLAIVLMLIWLLMLLKF